MEIAMTFTPQHTALIIHAIAAPVIFVIISFVYFNRYSFTSPFQTAYTFMAVVVLMDTLVIAKLILKSFEMFSSFIGTWLPFILIFMSTYLTGLIQQWRMKDKTRTLGSK
jgi:hypothetical protein